MTNRQPAGSTRETAVSNQRTLLTHVHTLDIRGGIKHLLHTRTTLRTFVGNHYAVALIDFSAKDTLTGIFLRIEDNSRSLEVPQALVNTSSFHDATVLSDIAKKYSQSTVLGVSMG